MNKYGFLNVDASSDLEIVMTRDFAAPRALVFQAYTDPALIPRWWGLGKHDTSVDKMDVRPGGAWRFICRDPEGGVYAFRGEYREVVPPERLVYTFEFEPMAGHVMTETIEFHAIGAKTRVTTRSAFASREDRDGMIASGMEKGAAESCDRLEKLLHEMARAVA